MQHCTNTGGTAFLVLRNINIKEGVSFSVTSAASQVSFLLFLWDYFLSFHLCNSVFSLTSLEKTTLKCHSSHKTHCCALFQKWETLLWAGQNYYITLDAIMQITAVESSSRMVTVPGWWQSLTHTSAKDVTVHSSKTVGEAGSALRSPSPWHSCRSRDVVQNYGRPHVVMRRGGRQIGACSLQFCLRGRGLQGMEDEPQLVCGHFPFFVAFGLEQNCKATHDSTACF